ncbi:hypothetical protein PRIPAC_96170 [Pristionchus pacificus]|uniref:Decapping nuclease n=1 Tax=Pristionchus pacificus TaxID=54126 RepID=A0A2A6BD13_PRIPA|nr:hypothetical protein PRIPAC_96170 [Pristionchus pacificus]|eukprot:PDM63721.1 hypothetical protein PRIPAC_49694 [Pristionchus pacificus]
MSKDQIKIRKYFYRDRKGILDNKRTISELSIRKGKVNLDRRNARYLVEENIREDANYDLKVGLREYYEESDSDEEPEEVVNGVEEAETTCCTFCAWACSQPQKSLKAVSWRKNDYGNPPYPVLPMNATRRACLMTTVFGGADFVTYRTLIRDIAKTIITHRPYRPNEEKQKPIQCDSLDEVVFHSIYRNKYIKPWAGIAMKAGDVIIIREDDESPFLDDCEEYSEDEEEDEEDEEDKEEEEEEKKEMTDGERLVTNLNEMKRNEIRQRAYSGFKFQQYMTSEEPEGKATPEKRLRIRSFLVNEPIELKSTFAEGFCSKIHTFLHCNFGNMETFVTGQRDENYITTRAFERKTSHLKNDFTGYEGDSQADEQCFSFLYDVLSMTKQVLSRAKACRFVYMPKSGIIQFEPITIKEARKRGHDFPEEFKSRFDVYYS